MSKSKSMSRSKAINDIPKMHTLWRRTAEEIAHLVYPGNDRDLRKTKTREIEAWLADGNFFGDETPAELAGEWQEYDLGSGEEG